jgi:GrpB-like predicted nucleotidyltransferase (UPF0157 family)
VTTSEAKVDDRLELLEHDVRWSREFEAERARLRPVLGDGAVAIEHIGSTSVPRLRSQPVIDVLVGLRDPADRDEVAGALTASGYERRREFDDPGRLYLRRRWLSDGGAIVCASVAPVHGDFFVRHVAFRDRLRADPDLAARYSSLKARMVADPGLPPSAYEEAKTAFVQELMDHDDC